MGEIILHIGKLIMERHMTDWALIFHIEATIELHPQD